MILLLALLTDPAVVPQAAGAVSRFSDPVVIAMIGTQLCLIIAAIVQGTLSILARSDRREAAQKMDSLSKDTEAIKGHVNSEKTASDGREAAARLEIGLLRDQLAHERTNAGLLAHAVATRGRGSDAPAEPVMVEVVNVPLETTTTEHKP
jgi:hypothetical protein